MIVLIFGDETDLLLAQPCLIKLPLRDMKTSFKALTVISNATEPCEPVYDVITEC